MEFETFLAKVGGNVRKARWSARLTQDQLGDAITYRLLVGLEKGRGNPTLRTLFRLCQLLDVSVSELLDVEPVRARHVPLRERSGQPPKRGRKPTPRKYPKKRSRSTK